MESGPVAQVHQAIAAFRDGRWTAGDDTVSVEAPLEIRLETDAGEQPITVTMRTPGQDAELAVGFLFAEGIIQDRADITAIACGEPDAPEANVIRVRLRPGLNPALERQARLFVTSSSCGVCGKTTLDAAALPAAEPAGEGPLLDATVICSFPARLRQAQAQFGMTGGIHATGLFEPDGTLVALREDVGRHNAFDKLVGSQLLAGALEAASQRIAVLSGRASYELLQKALQARIPVVCAIGAPSSLAVAVAERFHITLTGFTKATGFNVYTGRERVRG
ncbi:MAG: formate dehydrogenase accessory sulfurtransferase FdhD [Dehalococcoidia bacterium]